MYSSIGKSQFATVRASIYCTLNVLARIKMGCGITRQGWCCSGQWRSRVKHYWTQHSGQVFSTQSLFIPTKRLHHLEFSTSTTNEAKNAKASSDDGWQDMFAQLLEFKEKFGNCHVPSKTTKGDRSERDLYGISHSLAKWVQRQRLAYQRGRGKKNTQQTLDRWALLEAVGFSWDTHEAAWNRKYQQLESFKIDIPTVGEENSLTDATRKETKLGPGYDAIPGMPKWIRRQRDAYQLWHKSGTSEPDLPLTLNRVEMLESIGLTWDTSNEVWEQNFQSREQLFHTHGHSLVDRDSTNPLNLWSRSQRLLYRQGKLNPDRCKKLTSINFIWDQSEWRWNIMFNKLRAFQLEHGHCIVQEQGPNADRSLVNWIDKQRKGYKRWKEGKPLSREMEERIRAMESIGFSFDVREKIWDRHYQQLYEFMVRNGHSYIPVKERTLYNWVVRQRREYKELVLAKQNTEMDKLAAFRIEALNRIGFRWYSRTVEGATSSN